MNYHLRLSGEPPMPPRDADFAFKIDFKKGLGNPRRVFDAASALIDAFEFLDDALIDSVDSKIEPLMVLEDVESGSLKVYLRNILIRIDDEALKPGDWKLLVGHYLVQAKYIALDWLDNENAELRPKLADLKRAFQKLAQETDIRQFPDYPPIHEGRLITALDKLQSAKCELAEDDRLTIEYEGHEYEVNLSSKWKPSATVTVSDATDSTSHGEMILTVRKPDFLRNTMWQFSLRKDTITAPIKDDGWLDRFHKRQEPLSPGDALKCAVTFAYVYDNNRRIIESRIEIDKVLEVIKGTGPQSSLL